MKPTDVLVFDGCSITSKVNASVPTWGGCCHSLHTDSRNYLIIRMDVDEGFPNDHRSIMCEQPSGELHRTGCFQQHAPRGGKEQK